MFLKSVLQVAPSPRTAPPPSLHVFLAIKLQPQNLARREPQTSAEVLRLCAYRIVQENLSECCSHHSYPCFLFVVLFRTINQQGEDKSGRARRVFAGAGQGVAGGMAGRARNDGRIFPFPFSRL